MYDPRNWGNLDAKLIDIVALKGPKRDLSIENGLKDKFKRHFSSKFYIRILPNGEKRDREWLVYSKELDKVFCFCCKLFGKYRGRNDLVTEGFNDWRHLSERLGKHEMSVGHVTNMGIWFELKARLGKNKAIDNVYQQQLLKEKEHWKNVLVRVISVVKFLAKRNLAFRGSNEKLYEDSNGNFLGLIEMLAEFDLVIREHVSRITSNDTHFHYLGHNIQNELINLLATNIESKIIKKIKDSKYFSVILDCTPDISHKEQMTVILRYVDTSSVEYVIEESFLGFFIVNDTSGLGLFEALQCKLKSLDLDIDNIRGQGYDNGSNMKGKHQGVQKRMLDLNPRAFYTPCACHSLNLTLCDIANTCVKARDFFGTIQRIYTIFSYSTKRWQVLKNNVKGLTLKPLSSTRWESRVDSVKAIRFQMSEIREALLEVAEVDNDSKIRSEAKSLATNELGDFEFLVSIIIWYDILSHVNEVSKHLQTRDVLIDVAILHIKALVSCFEKYREYGFCKAMDMAKQIAKDMNIDPIFPKRREIRRKRHFDENPDDSSTLSEEELFRINYFLFLIDQAISSLKRRFEQYQEYENIFGFMFTSDKLNALDDSTLKSCCINLEKVLMNKGVSDIDGNALYFDLNFFKEFMMPNKIMGPISILNYIKQAGNCFPNAEIAYRILLTIPVTVASAERSFSKLKLLKSYLRSTMSQERLNGLAMIAIENNLLDTVTYDELIDDFAAKNARRAAIFK
ncbi:hypothetical protein RND81_12G221200 [Saponaria officinalis]|uniref:TTF-type domain-containing protein n=1 Tax=Saponaria officinalis TaxID=3572 RepID=A0AAW1HDX6_SAPOF